MEKQTQYTIHTEDISAVNRSLIAKAIGKHFAAFNMQTGIGYWENQRENSLHITIITDRSRKQRKVIERLAAKIRDINKQVCVLLTATNIKGKLI